MHLDNRPIAQTILLFTCLSLLSCRDNSKLLGDSNVYLDDPMSQPQPNDQSSPDPDVTPDTATEVDTALDNTTESVIEPYEIKPTFEAIVQLEDSPSPQPATLELAIKNKSLEITHNSCAAPCSHTFEWSSAFVYQEDFVIQIDYNFIELDSTDTCYYNLIYVLDFQDAEFPAGVYSVHALENTESIDLTSIFAD